MTIGDYVLTRETLMGSGITERCDLVCSMTPKRLSEFIDRLELQRHDPLHFDVAWILARTAGNRIRDLLEQIEALEKCSDPQQLIHFNDLR